jgi:hypothetical protein
MSFDSDSRAVFVDENPLADRLQKLVGLRLAFHLSSENSVTRVDGVKEFADRIPGNNNNAVRGTAGAVLGRFFNQQFYREFVEMGMLPKDPVKIGDQWTVSRQANAGLWGTSSLIEITYRFRGWQQHEGTNCARVDFSGTFKPNTVARTNQQALRRITAGPNSGSLEEGTITGQAWFNPELALAVDLICDQSITTKSTTIQRLRMPPGSNNVTLAGATLDTNGPPPVNPPQPPAPQTTNTTTTTTHQHTSIKLVELEPSPN